MPDVAEISAFDRDAAMLRDIQAKRTKQPISKNGKTPLVRKSGYDALDKNSFLKLLVTQLSKQDPTNPMNDKEFISQMAQFSSLEQMNNVANSMNKLRGAQASQLIGKMVEGKDFVTEKPIQGIVTSALYQPNGDVLLKIGGRFTKFDDVVSVTEVTPASTPSMASPLPAGEGSSARSVSRETILTPPTVSPLPQGERPRVMPITQTNSAQAAKVYEANQKSAPPTGAPLPVGESHGVRVPVKVPKGE